MNRNTREWLQEKVKDLSIRGHSQMQISSALKISQAQVSRILARYNEEARQNIQSYVERDMPISFSRTLNGLNLLLQECWAIIQSTENDSVENKTLKLKAISTCNEIYKYHTELMLDTRPLKEAVNFMRDRRKELMLNSINNNNIKTKTETTTELPIEDLPGEGINI